MQGWLNPRGRLPQATYWMRRALVLAVMAVVALLLGMTITRCTARPPEKSAATPSQATRAEVPASVMTVSPSVSTSPISEATPVSPSASAVVTPVPTPDVINACDPQQMRISVSGERMVKSPSTQKLSISVTNATGDACRLKLSPELISISIVSGPQTVWSTDHCKTWVPTTSTTLRGQQAHTWTVAWPTRSSSEGCSLSSAVLPSGTYVAKARIAGGPEATMVMELKR